MNGLVQVVITATVFLPLVFGGGNVFTDTVELNTTADVSNANYVIQRVNGVWSAMGTGLTGAGAFAIAIAPADGAVYMGGPFTLAGGVANTVRIAKWDGAAWSAMGTGLNDVVYAIAIAPNGDVYVGGKFTDVVGGGGGTYNNIARWDGSSWNAVGVGLDDAVYDIVIAANGDVYIGGLFTDVVGGGGGTYNNVVKWDGSAYSALGTGFAPAGRYCLNMQMALNGSDVYMTGNFVTGNGVTLNGIGMWNGTTFEALGSGVNALVYGMEIGTDGKLYAGGLATTWGGISANYIAMWDGNSWSALAEGTNAVVYWLEMDEDSGHIWVVGNFTAAGNVTVADRVTIWAGSGFIPVDVDLPGVPYAYRVMADEHRLFLSFNTSGTAKVSGSSVTTVTHAGTTKAFPTITITRSGGTTATLESIKNLTTGRELLFDHAMLDGEKIVIDLTPGDKTITTYVGDSTNNALNDCLPGSDFGTFCLMPGDNDIALYISETGSPTLTAFIQWQTTHPTNDGAPQ